MHVGKKDRNQEPYYITKKECPISQSDEKNDLGIMVDIQLIFETHIMQNARKASCIFAMIRRTIKKPRSQHL